MKKSRKFFSYLADIIYALLRFPSAWFKLWVVYGYFTKDENGKHQKMLFAKLLEYGFNRTPWQVVFPGQTAGVIKDLNNDKNEQYHIRFYDDGTIDCELELNRFERWHWAGPKDYGPHLIEKLLDDPFFDFSDKQRSVFSNLFGKKPFPFECMRPITPSDSNSDKNSLLPDSVEESE